MTTTQSEAVHPNPADDKSAQSESERAPTPEAAAGGAKDAGPEVDVIGKAATGFGQLTQQRRHPPKLRILGGKFLDPVD